MGSLAYLPMCLVNPLSRIVPWCALNFIILLCLMPDDFTRQGESAGAEWVTENFYNNLSIKLKFVISFPISNLLTTCRKNFS